MRLVSDSVFDIKEYNGHMVILYPDGRADLVASLREKLDAAGYVYHVCAVGQSLLEKGRDISMITSLLDRCVCLVPVLCGSLFEPEQAISRAMFWFFTGYMRAGRQEAIVPYIPANESADKVDLSGTPLQGIDIMFDSDTFMEKIPAKFAGKLLCYNYYENRTTNLYASRRISYHCLRLSFKVYEQAFQNARQYYNDTTGFSHSDYEFESYLESNLSCGCRVASFGADHKLEPQMVIYKSEIHPRVADYPKTQMGKSTIRHKVSEADAQAGVRFEFVADVLVPVHSLLGAYIKCYLTCPDPDCPVFMLAALMEGDFSTGKVSVYDPDDCDIFEDEQIWNNIYPEGTFIDTRLNRLYFPIGLMADGELMAADPGLHVGSNLDYVFPM